ncbi:calcium-binding protein [Luteimonas sp. 3794]|uniref:calcium-binding protein n=1 Tax=Luteimonas sp. 3794 TaxID=2817730 RepID=UPI002854ECA6|nr:calcium-binding protein [Luteimonas sp. 3794]MDR6990907.1 erythromycin esterase-like protein [Luteimonas sp. 3794]
MTILRHTDVITTARHRLTRLASGLLLLAASTTAAADWRSDAVNTLVRESGAHRLVVLGEMHGTREIPLLAGDLVEHWSEAAPVLLALEIPTREHSALREAVTGGGTDALIDRLRQRPWWALSPEQSDGRRSEDVLSLVQRIGALRSAGHDVAILPFDPRSRDCYERGNCEAVMADMLRRAYDGFPAGRIVVVVGNLHAMRQRPTDPASPFAGTTPMTAHLHDLAPVSIDITAERGQFWACQDIDACGTVDVSRPRPAGRQPADAPYHYRLVLPAFTPIRQVGEMHR